MLDPRGSHAQGHRFLQEFFAWLGLGESWLQNAHRAVVFTEAATASEGRSGYIDILVSSRDHALAIENKPWAVDQDAQVARYLNDLEARFPISHGLLYLSGDGSDPSDTSINSEQAAAAKAAGTLIVRGYAELCDWLEACLSVSRAPSVDALIESFIKHIRVEFMGISETAQAADLPRTLVASTELLEGALAIYETEVPLKTLLLTKTVEQVRLKTKHYISRADIGPLKDSGLLLSFTENSNLSFGIQFDAKNFGYLFYGVESKNGRALKPAVKRSLQNAIGSNAQTPWWPVWKRVGPNDRFFPLQQQVDASFWLAAHNGALAEMIVTFADRIYEALSNDGVLDSVAG